jgi:predicted  nucleic acid-binding Zn-ribbon protein
MSDLLAELRGELRAEMKATRDEIRELRDKLVATEQRLQSFQSWHRAAWEALTRRLEDHENRIRKLEGTSARIGLVWTVGAAFGAGLLSFVAQLLLRGF